MDPHHSYPDESEQRWYGGEQYGEPAEWERRDTRFDRQYDESYRVPEPRGAALGTGAIGPRSGEPLPPLPPREGLPPREALPPREPLAPPAGAMPGKPGRRPAVGGPAPDGIYRAKRPAAAIGLAVAAVVVALPLLRVLLHDAFGPHVSAGGAISSALTLAALPLSALGLYGLVTGAARVPDVAVTHAWLRPPLAYLLIGLGFLVAAGLAAS